MAALRSRCRHIFVLCFLLLLSSALFPHPSPNLSGSRVNVYQISTHGVLSANLGCRSEMCYSWLAGNTGSKNSPSAHHRTNLSGYIFTTKAYIGNRKKVLNSNISYRCRHNMVNYGLLTAEIVGEFVASQQISTGFASWLRYCSDVGENGAPFFSFPNCTRARFSRFDQQHSTEGGTYIQLGGHHVWHRPTF